MSVASEVGKHVDIKVRGKGKFYFGFCFSLVSFAFALLFFYVFAGPKETIFDFDICVTLEAVTEWPMSRW